MGIKSLARMDGTAQSVKIRRLFGIAFLACLLVAAGNVACKKGEEAVEAGEESGVSVGESGIEFEGTVKVVQGKYMYIPEAQGFDIVVQGALTSGDLDSLLDKEIRGIGDFSPETPSLLVANTIEMKNEAGSWVNIFTRGDEAVFDDYMGLSERDGFSVLDELAYDEKDYWEEFEQGKVLGQLEETEGAYSIIIYDERERVAGRIIIDEMSDLAHYYVKKLGLFDRFWFYLTVKETVDWSQRRNTREMFHADILFAGLF